MNSRIAEVASIVRALYVRRRRRRRGKNHTQQRESYTQRSPSTGSIVHRSKTATSASRSGVSYLIPVCLEHVANATRESASTYVVRTFPARIRLFQGKFFIRRRTTSIAGGVICVKRTVRRAHSAS